MDRSKGRTLSLRRSPAKADAPKLRSRLQKSIAKYRHLGTATPAVSDTGASATAAAAAAAVAVAAIKDSIRVTTRHDVDLDRDRAGQMSPVSPPDLSDAKWSEYLRGSGCVYQAMESWPRHPNESGSGGPPVNIIPEFSHLAISSDNRAQQHRVQHRVASGRAEHEHERHRSPSDTSSSSSTCVSSSPSSYSRAPPRRASMRRRAKTPIFSIGQLDAIPRPHNTPSHREHAASKTESVELIAEQYRALLESRNSVVRPLSTGDKLCSDSHSEPPPPRLEDRAVQFDLEDRVVQLGLENLQTGGGGGGGGGGMQEDQHDSITSRLLEAFENEEPPTTPPQRDPRRTFFLPGFLPGTQSPTSEADTLVSFEEDTIYFKPVSFSPEPVSFSPEPASFSPEPASFSPELTSSPRALPEHRLYPDDPHLPPLALQGRRSSDQLPPPPSSFRDPPHHDHHHHQRRQAAPPSPAPSSPATPGNLSLQICLDLLARDLACAITDRPNHQRPSPDAAALQVWVMIEAYERLRDHVVARSPLEVEEEEKQGQAAAGETPSTPRRRRTTSTPAALQAMIDMWLPALYALHNSLTEEARAAEAEDEAEVADEPEDGGEDDLERELGLPVEELD